MSRAGDGGDGGGGQLLMSHFTELAGAQLAVQSQWVQLTLALTLSLACSAAAASSPGGCVMCWKMDRVGRPLSGLMAHL